MVDQIETLFQAIQNELNRKDLDDLAVRKRFADVLTCVADHDADDVQHSLHMTKYHHYQAMRFGRLDDIDKATLHEKKACGFEEEYKRKQASINAQCDPNSSMKPNAIISINVEVQQEIQIYTSNATDDLEGYGRIIEEMMSKLEHFFAEKEGFDKATSGILERLRSIMKEFLEYRDYLSLSGYFQLGATADEITKICQHLHRSSLVKFEI
jgi:hypothetical protein